LTFLGGAAIKHDFGVEQTPSTNKENTTISYLPCHVAQVAQATLWRFLPKFHQGNTKLSLKISMGSLLRPKTSLQNSRQKMREFFQEKAFVAVNFKRI